MLDGPGQAAPAPQNHQTVTRGGWVLTAVLVALALGLRIAFLLVVSREPGFGFSDPDHYLLNGARLASPERGFAWTFDAVAYHWGNRAYVLPPLYPTLLGVFARFGGFPWSAAIGQAAIWALAVVPMVLIGTRVHSQRAGLIAGGFFALWGSSIVGSRFFMQEALYVPVLVVAFLLLVRAWPERTPRGLAIAGFGFGLAALCRSMPIYFIALVALWLVASTRSRAGLVQAGALVGGFAALTVPYSLALSIHLGALTFIENHGGILVATRLSTLNPGEPPGLGTVAITLLTELVTQPATFVGDVLDRARSLMQIAGGRYVQQAVNAASSGVAQAWKLAAHALIDVPAVTTLLLAPAGVALARDRQAAVLLAAWALLTLGLTSLTGFGGARLRAPFEPCLMLLAAVVLAGRWTRPSLPTAALAAVATVLSAVAVLPQIPRTLASRGNYGVLWAPDAPPHRASLTGAGGANVLLEDGVLAVTLRNPGPAPATARVLVEGHDVASSVALQPGEARVLRILQPRLALAFVEVEATDAAKRPAPLEVTFPRR